MKGKHNKKSHRVNQVDIESTQKPITPWGGIDSLIAKFLEEIDFRSWVERSIPIIEKSNNGKGIYQILSDRIHVTLNQGALLILLLPLSAKFYKRRFLIFLII